jgi:hypothetical protein
MGDNIHDMRGEGVNEKTEKPKRQYPPLYEKLLPAAMVIVAVLILVILGIVLAVLLGLFPGT